MARVIRHLLHKYLPSNLHDPVGLTARLLRSRDPAAHFALRVAALGVLASPLDLLLAVFERRLYRRAVAPRLPLIFVVGPPRSGTTLVAQALIRNLPVSYLNNLAAVFPRAPIVSNRLLGRLLGQGVVEFRSYYGRTRHLSGPSDSLQIWDRWLGKDRGSVLEVLTEEQRDGMIRFFGALESFTGKPLVNKNNSLNLCASLVAETLDSSRFICLERDRCFLAQSLLRARTEIHGDAKVPYGVRDAESAGSEDPVESVCRQVLFHEEAARRQQERIGIERFWIVSYEEFCARPAEFVKKVAREILDSPIGDGDLESRLPPFEVSNKIRIEKETFERIQATFSRLEERGVRGSRSPHPN